MNPAVAVSVGRGVATVTMDQPHNRNALTPALLNGLGDALAATARDPLVRVVVLTHTGPAFCAGADLTGRTEGTEAARYELAEVLNAILDSAKPVIARVAGHCLGGGVGLAAACDLAIASEDARFGFTEVRVGVAPAVISVVCLPKMRRADALELFLTGARIDARRAAHVGLITEAVALAELDPTVTTRVEQVKAGAPGALAAAKRLVFDVPGRPRAEAFADTTRLSQELFASAEAAEGMAAFREKRSPSWTA